ncbi:MAG: plasmid pRiA4b ORF-3 family protein [Prevotellaceae bacterium]|jgi:hypothetical protein|nr:plasmid pRiA4b ORF-3 family protein [Prevotellaceae bacterium]
MIYRFTATVDSLKGFMRQYELRGSNTLYELHGHIVNDLNFAPDQMVLFRVESAKGKPSKTYGLFDLGDGSMDEIHIEQLVKQKETTLLYVFDMHDNRALRLSFVKTDEELPRKSYPRTSDEKGDPPSQFLDPQDDDEEIMNYE